MIRYYNAPIRYQYITKDLTRRYEDNTIKYDDNMIRPDDTMKEYYNIIII